LHSYAAPDSRVGEFFRLKNDDKIIIRNSGNNSKIQVRINGQGPLKPKESSEIKPGDTLKLGNQVYLFDKDNNYKLRFIRKDEKDTINKLFPLGVKNIDFCQSIGDCYLLSTLKSLSKNPRGAELLMKMIEPMSDGGYKVTFPGLPKESFEVTRQDIQNMGNAEDSVKSNHLGVKIIEHAYFKLRKNVDESLGPEDPRISKYKTKLVLLNFGDIGEALYLLTGMKTLFFPTEKLDDKMIKELFKTLKANNMPTVAMTGKNISPQGNMTKSMHAYCISEINPEKEEVTIINPDDSSKESKISYKTFLENFTYISCVNLKSQ